MNSNRLPTNPSETVKRLNPHLWPDGRNLASVEAQKPEPGSPQALVGSRPKRKGSKAGVAYRVTLVGCLRRVLDGDNLVASLKPARDAIAFTLGVDDADGKDLSWEYGQLRTTGEEGVIVKIERRA